MEINGTKLKIAEQGVHFKSCISYTQSRYFEKCVFLHTMKVNRCLSSNVLENIFSCVLQKIKCYENLERLGASLHPFNVLLCPSKILINIYMSMKIIVYWPENIFSYNILIVFSDLESELVMPDSQMTHSIDQIGQTSLQKGLQLFVIHFDSFGFIHLLKHFFVFHCRKQNLQMYCLTKQLFIARTACERLCTAGIDNLYPFASKIAFNKILKIRADFIFCPFENMGKTYGGLCHSTDETLETPLGVTWG